MNEYEQNCLRDALTWKKKLLKKTGSIEKFSRKTQLKMNRYIPDKIHTGITASIRYFIETMLTGSGYITKEKEVRMLTFQQKEEWVQEKIGTYRKTAVIEGIGTGAGGLLIGLTDFPLLLSIQMKLLFDISGLYGFNAKKYEERLFILYIFHITFSSNETKLKHLPLIERWNESEKHPELDWYTVQQEYRDYVDLVKMLQLVPGIGAAVGAYANHNLLVHLGETAQNCFRLRMLEQK
ncbi:EcsC family protein [Peribacillus psychrosaccharolyticus]|uniref:EcsC family protein n=1 Tax=Peribacillus psychrosaccharolyticus TaxID=1407 RepID=UPI003D267FD2